MATNYVGPGDVVDLTAPGGGVTSGVGVLIGDLFVVPQVSADATETFAAATRGVFTLPKLTTAVIAEGALVYWDPTPGEVNVTATSQKCVGLAVEAAGNGVTSVKVLVIPNSDPAA